MAFPPLLVAGALVVTLAVGVMECIKQFRETTDAIKSAAMSALSTVPAANEGTSASLQGRMTPL
jgi:hypothetical protein